MDKCKHPEDQREPYHDMTVKCCACNCVIEQFGKPIDPPSPLSPKIWPVESSCEPSCSTAKNSFDAAKKAYIELTNNVAFSERGNAVYVADQSVMDALDEYFESR